MRICRKILQKPQAHSKAGGSVREPVFWGRAKSWQAFCLWPLSVLYGGLVKLRSICAASEDIGKSVICIGNLTLGGAGKTPIVQMLVDMLKNMGYRPAILSRGYGGSTSGPLKIDPKSHVVCEVGDEPLMMAQKNTVYIARNRRAAARLAIREGADILVKDDGFQNPHMTHALNLIVIDAASGVGNGRIFPAGPLREALSDGLARLDALIVIHAEEKSTLLHDSTFLHDSTLAVMEKVASRKKPIFHADITAVNPHPKKVIAFCGIAKPQKFYASLARYGYETIERVSFPDHHNFSPADIDKLDALTKRKSAPLVTTAKDMTRLITMRANTDKNSTYSEIISKIETFAIKPVLEHPQKFLNVVQKAIEAREMVRPYTKI